MMALKRQINAIIRRACGAAESMPINGVERIGDIIVLAPGMEVAAY